MDVYIAALRLYRRIVPRRARDLLGRVRSRAPGWNTLQADVGAWSHHVYAKPQWEREYRHERWSYMRGLTELARYSVIAGYISYLRSGGSILDLGCGEGILRERLDPASYSRYVGVDIAQTAIDAARARSSAAAASFICCDITTFEPDAGFDVIVLNEVLYYVQDPIAVLRRYQRCLQPDGILILSSYAHPHSEQNWRTLEQAFHFFDETRTSHVGSGCAWSCRVLRAL